MTVLDAGIDGITIHWFGGATSTTEALRSLGADAAGHLCLRCGSDTHGVPWARIGDTRLAVSASRSGRHLVVAVRPATQGALGVDVEAADAPIDADLVLHPDERASTLTDDRPWIWAAKEAVVKHLGTGLRTDPTTLRLTDFTVQRIPAPEGFVAAVCVGAAH